MALYVNTNVSSLNAQRKLSNATLNLNTSYQRLSSGLRINSAKDDAAGLMIANRLTAQINGLNQGNRNANDGIALAQTIEGALDETTNMLQRIRTLAVQSANGTNTDDDRKSIQDEVTQLCREITRIAQKTTFGGAKVLDGYNNTEYYQDNNLTPPNNLLGSTGILDFQVGSNAYDTLSLKLTAGFQMKSIVTATQVRIKDDKLPFSDAKNIGSANQSLVALFHTEVIPGQPDATKPYSGGRYSVSSQYLAQLTLSHIDDAIKFVDSKRSALGALQNRMESTIRNQASISENESDARARIRDTDFAAETAALTQNNIIQNASQSILTQANQRPNVALQLLNT